MLLIANLHHQIEVEWLLCNKIRTCQWVLGSFSQWKSIFTLDLTVAVILCAYVHF